MLEFPKSPKCIHVEDSRLPDDSPAAHYGASFGAVLAGRLLIVEEKVDGSEAGIGFDEDASLVVVSRGNPAPRDHNFAPLWAWAEQNEDALFDMLDLRYVLYAEWMHLLHTVFYDRLPGYLLHSDMYDRETGRWLDTPARFARVAPLELPSVPILKTGPVASMDALRALVGPASFRSDNWVDQLFSASGSSAKHQGQVCSRVDPSGDMEGLYIKVEEGGHVVGRYKWIRPGFLQAILDSGQHWKARPPVANLLRPRKLAV